MVNNYNIIDEKTWERAMHCMVFRNVTFTHISHTNSGKKDNATPLFDWGKYYEKNYDTDIGTGASFVCGWNTCRTICEWFTGVF